MDNFDCGCPISVIPNAMIVRCLFQILKMFRNFIKLSTLNTKNTGTKALKLKRTERMCYASVQILDKNKLLLLLPNIYIRKLISIFSFTLIRRVSDLIFPQILFEVNSPCPKIL